MCSSLPEPSVRDGILGLRQAVQDALSRATGSTPVVLIDGPSGAGKSSLADLLASHWPGDGEPRLIRMDDLYPGWSGLDAGSDSLGADLLAPLRRGEAGFWRPWNWAADTLGEREVVSAGAPLIVEGCGTLSRRNSPLADLRVWLDADDILRKDRALARDGVVFETHWDQWQHDFERYVDRERPRDNADLVLDVTTWPLGVRAATPEQD
ncbi:MAG TPA: ATP-binding protein [Leifsonia sp.]|nr:ATP-binding protein [Leifsonia sp.]